MTLHTFRLTSKRSSVKSWKETQILWIPFIRKGTQCKSLRNQICGATCCGDPIVNKEALKVVLSVASKYPSTESKKGKKTKPIVKY